MLETQKRERKNGCREARDFLKKAKHKWKRSFNLRSVKERAPDFWITPVLQNIILTWREYIYLFHLHIHLLVIYNVYLRKIQVLGVLTIISWLKKKMKVKSLTRQWSVCRVIGREVEIRGIMFVSFQI